MEGDAAQGGRASQETPRGASGDGQGNTGSESTSSQARGRGRGRGRGRKVAPRAVPRKKPPTRIVSAKAAGSGSSSTRGGRGGGSGRGRGADKRGGGSAGGSESSARGGRGRGRGRGQAHAQHSPSVIGLGQIAPQRVPIGGATPSQGSAASRKSSGLGTPSSTGALSRTSGQSFGSGGTDGRSSDLMGSNGASYGGAQAESYSGGRGGASSGGGGGGSTPRAYQSFAERFEEQAKAFGDAATDDSDTDDELPDDDNEKKNRDVAAYLGESRDGFLLPVTLPRNRTEKVDAAAKDQTAPNDKLPEGESSSVKQTSTLAEPSVKAEPVSVKLESAIAPVKRTVVKPEPMEVDTLQAVPAEPKSEAKPTWGAGLDPSTFPEGSCARMMLESSDSPVYIQLPGVLPLAENKAAWEYKRQAEAPDSKLGPEVLRGTEPQWSIKARGLAVDVRKVGSPGEVQKLGKLRLYKSGRVQLVLNDGTKLDGDVGATCRLAQQLACVTLGTATDSESSFEELRNSIVSRIVFVPSMETLATTGQYRVKKAPNE